MEFHSMKRKQLQALCKKHNIPANLSNLEMANRISEVLKGKEDPLIQRPIEGEDENVTETESADVIANKKVKKVRFSPEHELIEFAKSPEMKGKSKRNMVVSKSRGLESIEGNLNEKGRKKSEKGKGQNTNASAVEILDNSKATEGNVDSSGEVILLGGKMLDEGKKRSNKRPKDDGKRNERALDNVENEKLIEKIVDNPGRVTRSRVQKLTEVSEKEENRGRKAVKRIGNVAPVIAENNENKAAAGTGSFTNRGDADEVKLADDPGEKAVKSKGKSKVKDLENKIVEEHDVSEPQIIRRSRRNTTKASDSETLHADKRKNENGEGHSLLKKSKLMETNDSGVEGEGSEVNPGRGGSSKMEEPIKVERRRSNRRKNVTEGDDLKAETENGADESSKDEKEVPQPTGVTRRSRRKTLSVKLVPTEGKIDTQLVGETLEAETENGGVLRSSVPQLATADEASKDERILQPTGDTRRSRRKTLCVKSELGVAGEVSKDEKKVLQPTGGMRRSRRKTLTVETVSVDEKVDTQLVVEKPENRHVLRGSVPQSGFANEGSKDEKKVLQPTGTRMSKSKTFKPVEEDIGTNLAVGNLEAEQLKTETCLVEKECSAIQQSTRRSRRIASKCESPGEIGENSIIHQKDKVMKRKSDVMKINNDPSSVAEAMKETSSKKAVPAASSGKGADSAKRTCRSGDFKVLGASSHNDLEVGEHFVTKSQPSASEGLGSTSNLDFIADNTGSSDVKLINGMEMVDLDTNAPPRNTEFKTDFSDAENDQVSVSSIRSVEKDQLEIDVHELVEQNVTDMDKNGPEAHVSEIEDLGCSKIDNQELPEGSNDPRSEGFDETGSSTDSLPCGDQTSIKAVMEVTEAEVDRCLQPSPNVVDRVGEDKIISVEENLGSVVPREDNQVLPECSKISEQECLAETTSSADSPIPGDQLDIKTDKEEVEAEKCLEPNTCEVGEFKVIAAQKSVDSDETEQDLALPEISNNPSKETSSPRISNHEGLTETTSAADNLLPGDLPDNTTDVEVAEVEAEKFLEPISCIVGELEVFAAQENHDSDVEEIEEEKCLESYPCEIGEFNVIADQENLDSDETEQDLALPEISNDSAKEVSAETSSPKISKQEGLAETTSADHLLPGDQPDNKTDVEVAEVEAEKCLEPISCMVGELEVIAAQENLDSGVEEVEEEKCLEPCEIDEFKVIADQENLDSDETEQDLALPEISANEVSAETSSPKFSKHEGLAETTSSVDNLLPGNQPDNMTDVEVAEVEAEKCLEPISFMVGELEVIAAQENHDSDVDEVDTERCLEPYPCEVGEFKVIATQGSLDSEDTDQDLALPEISNDSAKEGSAETSSPKISKQEGLAETTSTDNLLPADVEVAEVEAEKCLEPVSCMVGELEVIAAQESHDFHVEEVEEEKCLEPYPSEVGEFKVIAAQESHDSHVEEVDEEKCLEPYPYEVGEFKVIAAQENLDSDETEQDLALPEISNDSAKEGSAETSFPKIFKQDGLAETTSADNLLPGDQSDDKTDVELAEIEAEKCLEPSPCIVGELKAIAAQENHDSDETVHDDVVLPKFSSGSGKEGSAEPGFSVDSLVLGDQTDIATDLEVTQAESIKRLQPSPNVADRVGEAKGISVEENLVLDVPRNSKITVQEGLAENTSFADNPLPSVQMYITTDVEVAEIDAENCLPPNPCEDGELKAQEKLDSDETVQDGLVLGETSVDSGKEDSAVTGSSADSPLLGDQTDTTTNLEAVNCLQPSPNEGFTVAVSSDDGHLLDGQTDARTDPEMANAERDDHLQPSPPGVDHEVKVISVQEKVGFDGIKQAHIISPVSCHRIDVDHLEVSNNILDINNEDTPLNTGAVLSGERSIDEDDNMTKGNVAFFCKEAISDGQRMYHDSSSVGPTTICNSARDNEVDLIFEGYEANLCKDKQSDIVDADESDCLKIHESSKDEEFFISNLFDGEGSVIKDSNKQVAILDVPAISITCENCNEVKFNADSSNLQETTPSKASDAECGKENNDLSISKTGVEGPTDMKFQDTEETEEQIMNILEKQSMPVVGEEPIDARTTQSWTDIELHNLFGTMFDDSPGLNATSSSRTEAANQASTNKSISKTRDSLTKKEIEMEEERSDCEKIKNDIVGLPISFSEVSHAGLNVDKEENQHATPIKKDETWSHCRELEENVVTQSDVAVFGLPDDDLQKSNLPEKSNHLTACSEDGNISRETSVETFRGHLDAEVAENSIFGTSPSLFSKFLEYDEVTQRGDSVRKDGDLCGTNFWDEKVDNSRSSQDISEFMEGGHEKTSEKADESLTASMVQFSIPQLHFEEQAGDIPHVGPAECTETLKESDVADTIKEYIDSESSLSMISENSSVSFPIDETAHTDGRTEHENAAEVDKQSAEIESKELEEAASFVELAPCVDFPAEGSTAAKPSVVTKGFDVELDSQKQIEAQNSSFRQLRSTPKRNARTILIHGTPGKAADMKENASKHKSSNVGDITAVRPAKRRALQDVRRK